MPFGCKNLSDDAAVKSKKHLGLSDYPPPVMVNGRIRADKVELRQEDGSKLGIFPISMALREARLRGKDLVQVGASRIPPVCIIIDYGKFCFLSRRSLLPKKWFT